MDSPTLLTHRLGWSRGMAYALIVLAVLGVLDGLRRAPLDRLDLAAALVAVVVVCLSYVLGIRPAVVETPEALVVRNPLRTSVIGWSDIIGLRNDDVLVVETTDRAVRCFALPRRNRRPITSARTGGQESAAGASDLIRARLAAQAQTFALGQSAPTSTTYAAPAVAALGVAVAAALLSFLVVRGA